MATLTAAQHEKIRALLAKAVSQADPRIEIPMNRTNAAIVISATDSYQDTTAGDYNTAIPLPMRTDLPASQKALTFISVAIVRYLIDNPTELQILQDALNILIGRRGDF